MEKNLELSENPVENQFSIRTDQSTPWSEVWPEPSSLQVNFSTISDNNLKSEKDTFKVHFARGDKEIEKMYDTLRDKQKQNVFVMTDLKKEDISDYINTDYYNLLGSEVLKKHEGTDITLTEVLSDLSEKNMTPIVIECGPTIMNKYWEKCKKTKDPCHIDMMYMACFEGKMKNECIGDELLFDEGCYKKIWESDKLDVKDDMENQGKLTFKVYQFTKQ